MRLLEQNSVILFNTYLAIQGSTSKILALLRGVPDGLGGVAAIALGFKILLPASSGVNVNTSRIVAIRLGLQ